jgi:hypothetical protein
MKGVMSSIEVVDSFLACLLAGCLRTTGTDREDIYQYENEFMHNLGPQRFVFMMAWFFEARHCP